MTSHCTVVVLLKTATRPGDNHATYEDQMLAANTVVKEAIERFLDTPLMRQHRFLFPSGAVDTLRAAGLLDQATSVQACRTVLMIAEDAALRPELKLAEIVAAVRPIVDRHATDTTAVLGEERIEA